MHLGQQLVRELIENAQDYKLGYHEHHAEQDGKDPEINVTQIFLVRADKETGYCCEYPGYEQHRVFLDSFQHSEKDFTP